jgi:triosephosphate isomerase
MIPVTRKPCVAGNWKMNLTLGQAGDLASAVVKSGPDIGGAEVVLIPPFTSLPRVKEVLAGSPVKLGGQNCHWEDKGAYTGEISPLMLKEAGCRYVLIGHSERRQYFGETDATVNKKIRAALQHGLSPIFCLGETLAEREQGQTESRIIGQLDGGLEGLTDDEFSQIVIAYEPVWAIGTGRTASPSQAEEVQALIRDRLSKKYGKEISSYAIILYGGSVKPDNAFSLYQEKNIDGFLVGGASLEAGSFITIIKEAIKADRIKQ